MIRTPASARCSAFAVIARSIVLSAMVLVVANQACAIDVNSVWTPVADYQTGFQSGTPAGGWTYAWNPTGKLGNSNGFSPLKWSTAAQGYNTIGDLATSGKKKKKKKASGSDTPFLQASGGHPGKSNLLPIVGYTVQPDDGAGLYRLIDSSIAKTDGIQSKKEDGLGVFVHVNNASVGPTQLVSTNGLISTFDRALGHLNVGDTVWVMVNPLKSHKFDTFNNFGFAIEKFAAITDPGDNSSGDPDVNQGTLPEPGTAALVLIALTGFQWIRRRRS
jgi:hypothetical protein